MSKLSKKRSMTKKNSMTKKKSFAAQKNKRLAQIEKDENKARDDYIKANEALNSEYDKRGLNGTDLQRKIVDVETARAELEFQSGAKAEYNKINCDE